MNWSKSMSATNTIQYVHDSKEVKADARMLGGRTASLTPFPLQHYYFRFYFRFYDRRETKEPHTKIRNEMQYTPFVRRISSFSAGVSHVLCRGVLEAIPLIARAAFGDAAE